MKKGFLLAFTILCFVVGRAQTATRDTIQVLIAAVKQNNNTTSKLQNRSSAAIILNGYIVQEKDKPNVYLDKQKNSITGYRILYTNIRRWETEE